MTVAAAATLVASILLAAPQAPPAVRVDTDAAMAQIVTKVEPVVPPAAAKARIGGTVIGDAIIRADGTVESVTILSGHETLHDAALAAFKAWKFKPFARGGRPVRVSVILEARFPDPIRDEEMRVADVHRTAFAECQRTLEARLPAAVAACEALVQASAQLRPERVIERTMALAALSEALLQQDRVREALAPAEQALKLRLDQPGGVAGAAQYHFMIAIIHQRLGDRAAAGRAYAAAEASFEAAIAESPRSADAIRRSLATVWRGHAALLRDAGDGAAAAALEAKIAAVDLPKPNPAPVVETLGATQFMRPAAPPLTADDRRNLLKLIAADGGKPWLVLGEWWADSPSWFVRVLQDPYVSRPDFRRGRVLWLSAKTSADGTRTWTRMTSDVTYAQVGELTAAGSLAGLDDPRMPIMIEPTPAPPLTDADVIGIVRFVRSRAVAPGPDSGRLLQSNVQPWPIASLANWSGGEVHVELREGRTFPGRGQRLTLRRDGAGWIIREMFATGGPQ